MTRPLKWILLLFGAAGLIVLAVIVFLVVDFPGQSTDHVVRRAVSPDGQVVAELHEVVTAMHGGPDLIRLTLSTIAGNDSAIVYSSVFECGPDFSGYDLRWQSAHNLVSLQAVRCQSEQYRSRHALEFLAGCERPLRAGLGYAHVLEPS